MEKSKYDFLVVYNTCGIRSDNVGQYIKSIRSILDSKTDFTFRVIMSSCLNSEECRREVHTAFGSEIDIMAVDEPHTVNITYNNSCLHATKQYGVPKGYLYIDSGVDFIDNDETLNKGFLSFLENDYGILSFQVDTDHGFDSLDIDHPVKGEDFIIPLGGAVNGHADLFSSDIIKEYGALWPDVFSAFCTESTFSFVAASVNKKWAILKDHVLTHKKGIDGPSLCVPHISPQTKTPWNNLLCGRDALDFINSKEAIEAGLGYEECNNIMMHNKNSYDDKNLPKNPSALKECIKKYLYLSRDELKYPEL